MNRCCTQTDRFLVIAPHMPIFEMRQLSAARVPDEALKLPGGHNTQAPADVPPQLLRYWPAVHGAPEQVEQTDDPEHSIMMISRSKAGVRYHSIFILNDSADLQAIAPIRYLLISLVRWLHFACPAQFSCGTTSKLFCKCLLCIGRWIPGIKPW